MPNETPQLIPPIEAMRIIKTVQENRRAEEPKVTPEVAKAVDEINQNTRKGYSSTTFFDMESNTQEYLKKQGYSVKYESPNWAHGETDDDGRYYVSPNTWSTMFGTLFRK